MEAAATLIDILTYYVWVGLAFAAAFIFVGIDRIDRSARGVYLFRVLILPGLVGLWPLAAWRWLQLEKARAKG